MQKSSLFPIPSPAFIACRFFDDGHSDQCEVISHGSFFVCLFLFIFFFLFLLFLSHGSFDLRFSSNDGGKEAQEGGRRHRYNYGEKNI